jgi:hypothetical protein
MVFVMIKSRNRKFTIAFTFATLGFVYLLEAILVISFNAYTYYPKIVDDLFQDAVLGNIFSQVSISCTTALIIVYNLSYKWYFLFSIVYYLIDNLFVKLGIYQHFWYRSIYTFIGLVLLFWFVKICYNKMIASSKYITHYIPLFLGAFAISGNTIILPLKLLKSQIFKADFYESLSKNHTTVSIIYGFFLINILINLYRWKLHWACKGIAFTILFFAQYILYKAGIIYFENGWFFIITLIDLFGFYFWIAVVDLFLSQKPNVTCDR